MRKEKNSILEDLKKNIKVLHLSAASENTGAGKATLLTHNALLHQNIKSRVLFLKSDLNNNEIYSYHRQSKIAKFRRLITTFIDQLPLKFYSKKSHSIFSPGLIGLNLNDNKLINWADVIHIHWANHGFIDIKEMKRWNKPIVWTLRDMWVFTGGCHYAFECENFKKKCGNCPSLNSRIEKDLSRHILLRKLKYFQGLKIHWVTISSWMKKQAKESSILKNQYIKVIPSGVDTSIFYITDREGIRTKLKLPLNKKIILLGASNIREKYKGFEYAIDVLNKAPTDFLVLTFGSGSFQADEIPQQTIHFGSLNYKQLCDLYNASDVFLGPSIAEAMGKTFLEAQLCGLPAVCFEGTGPEDIVKHLQTGYVAKFKDTDDLLHGIEFCLNIEMDRSAIRSIATELFDITKIAKSYISIYEKSLMDWRSL
jgi:glycosyltransferase involved in cell wall biosynthesis